MAPEKETRSLMKIEGNILEYPIFALMRGKRETVRIYVSEVKDSAGKVIEKRELKIANGEGIPTSFDMDVFNALMRIWTKNSYREFISFTVYEVAQELGLNPTNTKQRIKDAILNLGGTRLTFENAFYLNREYITESFSLFDNVSLYSRETDKKDNPRRAREINRIKLNEWLLRSIDSRYYKYIDFNTYRVLSSGVARRLFEFLEKKKLDKSSFKIGITKLAERLPLDTKKISQIKQILDKANAQLQKHNVITSWRYKDGEIVYRFPKSGLALKLAGEEGADATELPYKDQGVPEDREALVSLLTDRGITKAAAKSLVKRYPNRVAPKIEVFDWLTETKSPLIGNNPAGWLRKSIEEDWQPPSNFVSKAEQEERERKAEEQRQRREQAEAERIAEITKESKERKRRAEESPYKPIWDQVTEQVAGKIIHQSFLSWISPLFISRIDGNVVAIDCPSEFIADWVGEHYLEMLEEVVSEVQGRDVKIKLIYEEAEDGKKKQNNEE